MNCCLLHLATGRICVFAISAVVVVFVVFRAVPFVEDAAIMDVVGVVIVDTNVVRIA